MISKSTSFRLHGKDVKLLTLHGKPQTHSTRALLQGDAWLSISMPTCLDQMPIELESSVLGKVRDLLYKLKTTKASLRILKEKKIQYPPMLLSLLYLELSMASWNLRICKLKSSTKWLLALWRSNTSLKPQMIKLGRSYKKCVLLSKQREVGGNL